MPTTLKDIAATAGVSIGTVDRALKNRGRVNPQVAEKIKQLAKEMDYHPNQIASGLVTRTRHYKIAVILHITQNEFFEEILKGIQIAEKEIKDYGMSVEIYPCDDFNDKMQLRNIENAIEEKANAIVIVPINSPLIRKKIQDLSKQNFPVVFLTNYLDEIPAMASIHCDYFRSGRIGAMLLNLISGGIGHAIAFFPSTVMLGNQSRKKGCEDYFSKESGITLERVIELPNDPERAKRIMTKELEAASDVNYILFCGDADTALTSMNRINRQIHAVFYDLSAAAYNALRNGQICAVIEQSPENQGYTSINILFQYFLSKKLPPKEILMDSHIIFKESID